MTDVERNDGVREVQPFDQDKLVDAAIKFLRNPQVQSRPLSHKKAFLRTKGLSEQQIENAVLQSGIFVSTSHFPVSLWKRIQNSSFLVVVVCGASYGIYLIYRNLIKPYLVEKSDGLKNLTESIKQLETTVKTMQDTLHENQNKIKEIASQNNSRSVPREFQELKAEINSLKGLMLNRSSFPPPPPNLAVPPWQLCNDNGETRRSWEVVNEESEENNPQNKTN